MAYDASRAFKDAFSVTPDDDTIISAFGFYVGGDAVSSTAGDVTVMPAAQEGKPTPTPVTFSNCPVGFYIRDMVISRFMATGTTATLIVAFGPT